MLTITNQIKERCQSFERIALKYVDAEDPPDRYSGSMLSFLMDWHDFQPIDLVPIFASDAAVEGAISGRVNHRP
jgi:hypothetical protein